MKAHRLGCLIAFAVATAGRLAATPTPTVTDPKSPALVPVSFSVTHLNVVADGAEHQPTISVKPADATYSISGVAKAKEPGTYTFTATATGIYAGTITCKWSVWPKSTNKNVVRRGNIHEKGNP